MSEEKQIDSMISERELNAQTEMPTVETEEIDKKEGINKEFYQQDKKRTAEMIEKSGEKLKTQTSTNSNDDTDDDANQQSIDIHDIKKNIDEMKKLDIDEQVEYLVQVAIHKNPVLAIGIAKHLNSNYLLDELHSDLTEDKIRDILDKKGLL